jgi:hypothetical protein
MLGFDVPQGTTLESLVTEVLPAAHAKLVPPQPGSERLRVALHFFKGPSYTLAIAGARMTVTEGASRDVDLWIGSPVETARVFVADLAGPKRWAPKFAPPTDVKLLSDPRAYKLVKMVSGTIELAVTDLPEVGRASLWICLGPQAKKPAYPEDADVTIETRTATYEKMLAGSLGPEDALADGDVKITGKRLVAMQLALALAPLYPKR